jgi:hypothetical protein
VTLLDHVLSMWQVVARRCDLSSHHGTLLFLQLFATILDYSQAGEYDRSDGRSLRSFIERHETNVKFDEDVAFAEW